MTVTVDGYIFKIDIKTRKVYYVPSVNSDTGAVRYSEAQNKAKKLLRFRLEPQQVLT